MISLKKDIIIFVLISIILMFNNRVSLANPNISAKAAVLVDAETGEVLYKKNIHEKRPSASTTKIMTGILAIELGDLNDRVVTSSRAANEGGSSIYLEIGEELTLKELVYGLLIKSGNDAAVAIAEHIAGSVENFAYLMNQKAVEVGALNTTFKNPNGLPQKGHLTTAYDLAQITRYAFENNFFSDVVATSKKRISWPGNDWNRILINTNRLLKLSNTIDGVKTGYTKRAGKCLVASETRDGQKLISVLLKSNNVWSESKALLDYGFSNYTKHKLVEKNHLLHEFMLNDKYKLGLKAAKELSFVTSKFDEINIKRKIELGEDFSLPILKGEKLGVVSYYRNEKLLGRVDLIADRKIPDSKFRRYINNLISAIQLYF